MARGKIRVGKHAPRVRLVVTDPLEQSVVEAVRSNRLEIEAEIERLGHVDSPWVLVFEAARLMRDDEGPRGGTGGLRMTEVRHATGVRLEKVPEQLRTPLLEPELDLTGLMARPPRTQAEEKDG